MTTETPDINTQKLIRMAAPSFLYGLRSCGVKLSVAGDKLAYAGKPDVLTDELLAIVAARKADLMAALKSQPTTNTKPREPIGMEMEDFIAAIDWPKLPGPHPDPDADTPRGEKPPTEKQREILRKGNCFDVFKTRREASEKIKELIESGALSDFLSLEELERFDRRAPNRYGAKERRFCCPLCGGNKPLDASHRSLSVNNRTGEYCCHRCEAGGVLREFCGGAGAMRIFTHTGPAKEPADDRWKRWVALSQPIRDTEGATYLEWRGVPLDIAEAAGVRYGTWWRAGEHKAEPFKAVIFPIRDAGGKLVAAQARAIAGADKITRGQKSAGVFFATPGALKAKRIAITEAPIDALILAACGFAAIAISGTSWPAWLPGALVGKDVLLATDADEAGDRCARELAAEITGRATFWRLRPQGVKDWAELAELEGLDAVRSLMATATDPLAAVAELVERIAGEEGSRLEDF